MKNIAGLLGRRIDIRKNKIVNLEEVRREKEKKIDNKARLTGEHDRKELKRIMQLAIEDIMDKLKGENKNNN